MTMSRLYSVFVFCIFLATVFLFDFLVPNYRSFPSFSSSKNVSFVFENVYKIEKTNFSEQSSWQKQEEEEESPDVDTFSENENKSQSFDNKM